MARELKKIVLPNGKEEWEKGCGNYVCHYCGGKATALNCVAGLVLQVAAKHYGICGAYVDSEEYKGYRSDCSTCQYQENGTCTYEGKEKMVF
jgi:hypothetical protein